ncbi:MAG TPA: Error-prone repair protein ImuA [Ohtaekwangia sp.]|nr:Error-prone repair protein ImuA [Ohtaekwangia sp.]
MIRSDKSQILSVLKQDILRLEGFTTVNHHAVSTGLDVIKEAFPNTSFPLGCIHEFLANSLEDCAVTEGFLAGLLSSFLSKHGTLLWISASRKLFVPSLTPFGISPERFIFIDVAKEKDVLWAMDEALKCKSIAAVVGEVKEVSFNESRRFQLAAEQSQVTGFLVRHNARKVNTTACVSRWKISTLPSEAIDTLPGIGNPRWHVELLKIRSGKPQCWDIEWTEGKFVSINQTIPIQKEYKSKAG